MRKRFHTFRAATLDDAYAAMRRRLGDEAIVLRTSTVPAGGIVNTVLGRKLYEITATDTEPTVAPRMKSPIEQKYLGQATEPEIGSDERVAETLAYFKKIAAKSGTSVAAEVQESDESPADPMPVTESPVTYSPKTLAPSGRITPPVSRGTTAPAEVIPFLNTRPDLVAAESSATMDELRAELSEMRDMLQVLSAENPGAHLPREFEPHYHLLREKGVTRKRAAALVSTAARKGDLRAFRDPRVFNERLKMEIRKSLRVTGGTALEAGKRKVIALAGPTGVGKTTNLAKMAALFAVQERANVGVITTDTYRVAATDQLRVYANIIDLDMRVADEPGEVKSILRQFERKDLVLIDTAGGSPFNTEQMGEARALLEAAQPDETHLLVSAATSLDDLRGIVSHFSVLEPTALFFSKLDETQRFGALYCLAAESGLPLSYFSTGQHVPDDLQTASQGTVARLVLEGSDARGGTSTEPS